MLCTIQITALQCATEDTCPCLECERERERDDEARLLSSSLPDKPQMDNSLAILIVYSL